MKGPYFLVKPYRWSNPNPSLSEKLVLKRVALKTVVLSSHPWESAAHYESMVPYCWSSVFDHPSTGNILAFVWHENCALGVVELKERAHFFYSMRPYYISPQQQTHTHSLTALSASLSPEIALQMRWHANWSSRAVPCNKRRWRANSILSGLVNFSLYFFRE